MTVDELAQIIRRVDGDNSLGAGELAEAILAHWPQEWQPIETAPKDGTKFWAWWPNDNGDFAPNDIARTRLKESGVLPVAVVTWWWQTPSGGQWVYLTHQNTKMLGGSWPTLWQPLPEPPK